jgi:trypsin
MGEGMRLARPLTAIAAALCVLALPGTARAQSAQPRIISGSDVSSTAHPYQVRLNIRFGSSNYQCGGVIRDATHVMTAAHCVVNSGQVATAANVTVYYGNANRSLQSASSVYSVAPAPEYVAGDGTYDAALLTLNRGLAGYGSSTVQPVALASAGQVSSAVGAGANAIVSGWGLRATSVTLRADSVCRNVYGSQTYASARFVCAGGTGAQGSTNNPDSCSGDSGGPMVISTASGYALVGLVSFGPAGGCGRGGFPGAYTEVSNPGLYTLLTGQTAPAPEPAPAPAPAPAPVVTARPDVTPPRASVAGLRCRKRVCTVRVAASDNRGAVRSARARASRRVQVCVTRRTGERSCRTGRRTRNLSLAKIPGGFRGRFKLTPGSYRFSTAVTDAAGNRSRTVTLAFRVRR